MVLGYPSLQVVNASVKALSQVLRNLELNLIILMPLK